MRGMPLNESDTRAKLIDPAILLHCAFSGQF
jgi:hypothetical protein